MRTRVTDGDFIILKVPEELSQDNKGILEKALIKWLASKGLMNCQMMLGCSTDNHYGFEVLSVNDVFEKEVLG